MSIVALQSGVIRRLVERLPLPYWVRTTLDSVGWLWRNCVSLYAGRYCRPGNKEEIMLVPSWQFIRHFCLIFVNILKTKYECGS